MPHGRHDEEQLDADSAEGQHATQSNAEGRVGIPHLLGNVTGNLVGADGHSNGVLLEAEVTAHKH